MCGAAWAQALQPVPALEGHVVDTTGTLETAQRQALEEKLAAFERDKGAQIVLLLVPTTQPEDIAAYANRVANTWKIGRREVGDGVLLVVAKNDRKLRIEVAKALEGAVPDLAARQIIDEAIAPHLRQGDFAGGLQAGAERLMARVANEGLPAPAASDGGGTGFIELFDIAGILFFALFFVVPVGGAILRPFLGRKLGAVAAGTGMGAFALYLSAPLWVAVVAAGIALVAALLTGSGSSGRGLKAQRSGRRGGRAGRSARAGGLGGVGGWSTGGGSWGSSSSSSSSSDSFSSGGGGDFGGGGASGDW